MKAFIIHTPHKKSIDYANVTLASFEEFSGWEPELFDGVTVETLPLYEEKYNIHLKSPSRAESFFKENNPIYNTKKACSLNHYRLFKKCVNLNKPIAVVEHDAYCIADWKDVKFDDMLVMNASSAIKQKVFNHVPNKKQPSAGINDIEFEWLKYRHDPKINGAYMMPGTAAYAVTPRGASKMIDVYDNIGWEQSDFIINTTYVRIQTIIPELFTFKLSNLRSSHGENI